ncbi:MAG: hypothetical protein EPGJADBJ_04421 [Saprospiraceae bacterium]|nr:hypothetical protein [Saprospiraceae bacterium]
MVTGASHRRLSVYRNIEGAGIGAAVAVRVGISDGIGRTRSSVVSRARDACARERAARRRGAQRRQIQRQFVFTNRLVTGASHRRLSVYRNVEGAGIGAAVAVRVGISDGIGRTRSSVVSRTRYACARERAARRRGAQRRQVQRQGRDTYRLIAGASHRYGIKCNISIARVDGQNTSLAVCRFDGRCIAGNRHTCAACSDHFQG